MHKKPTIRSSAIHNAAALALSVSMVAAVSTPAIAGKKFEIDDTHWISLGAGMRLQGLSADDAAPDGKSQGTDFSLQSLRLYINGQVHENVTFTINTEKVDGESVEVLDGFAQFSISPYLNIMAGRMLTPADRIEMNGPYYGLSWNQYTQPLYPSDQGGDAGRFGRDEGITLWGNAGKLQYAFGIFDGLNGLSNRQDELLYAGRLAYNFLNKEDNPAYYTSSTYHGGLGNILTAGVSFQSQKGGSGSATQAGDFAGITFDVLSETVLSKGNVLTLEGEYKIFDADYTGGTPAAGGFNLFDGKSYFATAAFLFGQQVGIGKLQPYLRFVNNNPDDADSSDLTELGLNYVIDGHNLRLNANYSNGDAGISGYAAAEDRKAFSIGAQLQF